MEPIGTFYETCETYFEFHFGKCPNPAEFKVRETADDPYLFYPVVLYCDVCLTNLREDHPQIKFIVESYA